MDRAQRQYVRQLFELCRELPPEERAIRLASDAVQDCEVENEVRALLSAYDRSADFLEEPVLQRQAHIVERAIRPSTQLARGTRVGRYTVVEPIGAGGMGIVYRASDTDLGRDIALKLLPAELAHDPARRARLQTEARALATLNHPNIAAIHGIEDGALVMELVDGPTLEERLQAGPVPLHEVLQVATQMAEALEAAHEHGIIHRDLKPANVKITSEGIVKLLDFSLAKPVEYGSANGNLSPDRAELSLPGMIVGTAAYMSPEQATGKNVDKRSDIWAFGVVMYELLSGRPLFNGEAITDILAGVVRGEIDLNALPPSTPPPLNMLLRRCLERNPKRRLRDIGEARVLLEDLQSGTGAERIADSVASVRPVWKWTPALLVPVVLALGFLLWRVTRPVHRPLIRLSVDLGEDAIRARNITVAISPDGTRLAYVVRKANGPNLIATRLLEHSMPSVLAGSEGAADPFFSPDGRWIGFFTNTALKKISVDGGAAVTLCRMSGGDPRGAVWGEGGFIIANLDNSHLVRVPANGGTPEMLPRPEDYGEHTWRWPQLLPGGDRILFTGSRGGGIGEGYNEANIEVLSLRTGQRTVLHKGGYFGRYLPSGHLAWVHRGTLFVVPLDLRNLKIRGTPVPVLNDVRSNPDTAAGHLDFSSASSGPEIFAYATRNPAASARTLAWMDPAGRTSDIATSPGALTPAISPDGKRVAFSDGDDILLYSLDTGAITRLTSNGLLNNSPIWTLDGNHLIYTQQSGDEATIWWIRSDGVEPPQKLFAARDGLRAQSLSPDGRHLAFVRQDAVSGWDIWILPLDMTDPGRPRPGAPELFLKEPSNQDYPAFSPDGQWIAYSTQMEFERTELLVTPFPSGSQAPRVQVSTKTGKFPVWSHNGRELLFLTSENHVAKVTYHSSSGRFVADKPVVWSPAPVTITGVYRNFDISRDGKRIVTFPAAPVSEADRKSSVHVTLLLNFFDELSRRYPETR